MAGCGSLARWKAAVALGLADSRCGPVDQLCRLRNRKCRPLLMAGLGIDRAVTQSFKMVEALRWRTPRSSVAGALELREGVGEVAMSAPGCNLEGGIYRDWHFCATLGQQSYKFTDDLRALSTKDAAGSRDAPMISERCRALRRPDQGASTDQSRGADDVGADR